MNISLENIIGYSGGALYLALGAALAVLLAKAQPAPAPSSPPAGTQLRRRDDWKLLGLIAALVVLSRMAIVLIAYMGFVFRENRVPEFLPAMRGMWDQWDSHHYLYIAEHGYDPAAHKFFLISFGPLFPWLTKLAHFVIPQYFLAGAAVSNICLIGAAFFLHKLVRLDHDEAAAWRAVKYLLIYPLSFFLSITFSESVFLCFMVMSVYFLRVGKGWLAGAGTFLSVLARPWAGAFALVIVAMESWTDGRRDLKRLKGAALAVLGTALGVLAYLLLNKVTRGDLFAFVDLTRTKWDHHAIFFIDNLKDQARYLAMDEPSRLISLRVPLLATFFLAGLLQAFTLRKVRLSYSVYFFLYVLATYSTYWPISAARYVMSAFPLYLGLAAAGRNKWADAILTVLCAVLLAFYVLVFTKGSDLL